VALNEPASLNRGLCFPHRRQAVITRGGYNWADRYLWIVETALMIRQTHFVLDGEAVAAAASSRV
jgi:ATP-dependent DNA ligase